MSSNYSVLLLSGLLLPTNIFCTTENKLQTKPNVIFILADDFGYYDMSCMGSNFYETPNIDRIAKEGVVFTNGYAASQVSSPSRASIMTGKFPARHGITDYIGAPSGEGWRKQKRFTKLLPADYNHTLSTQDLTLAEAMKRGGYKTFFAGKWHLGGQNSWPENHGFDVNIGGWDAGSPKGGYFSPYENPKLENRKDGENLSMRLASETIQFIKNNNPQNTGQPVFAFLSFYAVHSPLETTRDKWAKYRQKAENAGIQPSGFKMGHFLPIRQVQDNPVYAGLIELMDDAIGHVLTSIDAMGLQNNTIIIFSSDNGGVVSGDAYSTSNLPLRAGKGYQFEGGIRVPFFIKVPGIKCAGERCSVPVIGTDFFPTILELAGLPLCPEEHLDGQSIVPLLKREKIPYRPLFWHYPHYGNQGGEPSSIIREGDWKLIYYYEDGRQELYNLETDPNETTDVSAKNLQRVIAMKKNLFSYLSNVNARFPSSDPEYNHELEMKYLESICNDRLPLQEKIRRKMLSPDYIPNKNWWGSMFTND